MLKCCKWRGKEIPQIFKDTRAAQKSLLTLLCCILTLTDSDESDESDNDDDNDNRQQPNKPYDTTPRLDPSI